MNETENAGLGKLAEALAKAQAEMSNAGLNKTNPHFQSRYADLAAIRDAILPSLNKHGLAVTQVTRVHRHEGGDSLVLVTRLIHVSGECQESEYPLPWVPEKPQIMGSAYTYARRYSLAALAVIAAEDDDDANAAQAAPATSRKAEARPRTITPPAEKDERGWTIIPPEAHRQADLSVVDDHGRPEWFAEPVPTALLPRDAKDRGLTWGDMVDGDRSGRRRTFLEWLASEYDYARKKDGTAKSAKFAAQDAVVVARAQSCLAWIEEQEPLDPETVFDDMEEART